MAGEFAAAASGRATADFGLANSGQGANVDRPANSLASVLSTLKPIQSVAACVSAGSATLDTAIYLFGSGAALTGAQVPLSTSILLVGSVGAVSTIPSVPLLAFIYLSATGQGSAEAAMSLRTGIDLFGAGAAQASARHAFMPVDFLPGRWAGRKRLLGRLYRSFARGPESVLALRLKAPGGLGGLRWTIPEASALESRALFVVCQNVLAFEVKLEGRTIGEVRDVLAMSGVEVAFATDDAEVLSLSALALVPGSGREDESNGDHLHAYTNLLWSWADPVGRWLDEARRDVAEMLRMLVVRQSGGRWSDLWASYFGIRRRQSETDASQNFRTEWEWRRARSNPVAMEVNIKALTGDVVTVREPWKEMMVVSGSEISGSHRLPNEEEFAYHRIQLVGRDVSDWDAAMEEAEADRPAGTLLIPPVTLPRPWHVPAAPPVVRFVGLTLASSHVPDFDGQIISETWNLSNTVVRRNPVLLIRTEPDNLVARVAAKATGEAKLLTPFQASAVGRSAAAGALVVPPSFAALAVGRAAGIGTFGQKVDLAGAGAALASSPAASLRVAARFSTASLGLSQGAAALSIARRFAAAAGAVASASASALSSTAVATDWPSANRSFLLDPDAAASRTLDGSGRISELRDVGGVATRRVSQGYAPARPYLASHFGRALASWDEAVSEGVEFGLTGDSGIRDVLRPLVGPGTLAVVWKPPATLHGSGEMPFLVAYSDLQDRPSNRLVLLPDGRLSLVRGDGSNAYDVLAAKPAGWVWDTTRTYLIAVRYGADGTIAVFVNGTAWATSIPAGSSTPAGGANAGNIVGELGYQSRAFVSGETARGKFGAVMHFATALSNVEIAALDAVRQSRYPGSSGAQTGTTLTARMFGTAAPPIDYTVGDNQSVVLGTRFRSAVPGQITHLRFYRSQANLTVSGMKLWTDAGVQLAAVTVPAGTAVGWVEVALGTPVAVTASTTYVVSYHAPSVGYPVAEGYHTVDRTSGPLTAPRSSRSGGAFGEQGAFLYNETAHNFPWQGDGAQRGYFADVVFSYQG